jgi:hypothetical protein
MLKRYPSSARSWPWELLLTLQRHATQADTFYDSLRLTSAHVLSALPNAWSSRRFECSPNVSCWARRSPHRRWKCWNLFAVWCAGSQGTCRQERRIKARNLRWPHENSIWYVFVQMHTEIRDVRLSFWQLFFHSFKRISFFSVCVLQRSLEDYGCERMFVFMLIIISWVFSHMESP